MSAAGRARGAWAVTAALVLSGCLPVPLPPRGVVADSRANLAAAKPEFIREGQTPRADVLLALGAPDRVGAGERWFAYSSATHQGGVAFIFGGYGGAGGILVEGYQERLLIVRFDEQGIVESVEFEEKLCPRVGLNESGRKACLDLDTLDLNDRTAVAAEPVETSFERVLWLRSRGCINPDTVGSRGATPATAFRGTLGVTGQSLVFTGRRAWTLSADDTEHSVRVPFAAVAGLSLSALGSGGALDLRTIEGLCYHIIVEGDEATAAGARLRAVLEERLGTTVRPP